MHSEAGLLQEMNTIQERFRNGPDFYFNFAENEIFSISKIIKSCYANPERNTCQLKFNSYSLEPTGISENELNHKVQENLQYSVEAFDSS